MYKIKIINKNLLCVTGNFTQYSVMGHWLRYSVVWGLPRVQSLGWKDPKIRKWQPTPGFLSEKFHGQMILVGYSPEGHK